MSAEWNTSCPFA